MGLPLTLRVDQIGQKQSADGVEEVTIKHTLIRIHELSVKVLADEVLLEYLWLIQSNFLFKVSRAFGFSKFTANLSLGLENQSDCELLPGDDVLLERIIRSVRDTEKDLLFKVRFTVIADIVTGEYARSVVLPVDTLDAFHMAIREEFCLPFGVTPRMSYMDRNKMKEVGQSIAVLQDYMAQETSKHGRPEFFLTLPHFTESSTFLRVSMENTEIIPVSVVRASASPPNAPETPDCTSSSLAVMSHSVSPSMNLKPNPTAVSQSKPPSPYPLIDKVNQKQSSISPPASPLPSSLGESAKLVQSTDDGGVEKSKMNLERFVAKTSTPKFGDYFLAEIGEARIENFQKLAMNLLLEIASEESPERSKGLMDLAGKSFAEFMSNDVVQDIIERGKKTKEILTDGGLQETNKDGIFDTLSEGMDKIFGFLDTATSSHPLLKVGWIVISAGYQIFKTQREIEEDMAALRSQFKTVYERIAMLGTGLVISESSSKFLATSVANVFDILMSTVVLLLKLQESKKGSNIFKKLDVLFKKTTIESIKTSLDAAETSLYNDAVVVQLLAHGQEINALQVIGEKVSELSERSPREISVSVISEEGWNENKAKYDIRISLLPNKSDFEKKQLEDQIKLNDTPCDYLELKCCIQYDSGKLIEGSYLSDNASFKAEVHRAIEASNSGEAQYFFKYNKIVLALGHEKDGIPATTLHLKRLTLDCLKEQISEYLGVEKSEIISVTLNKSVRLNSDADLQQWFKMENWNRRNIYVERRVYSSAPPLPLSLPQPGKTNPNVQKFHVLISMRDTADLESLMIRERWKVFYNNSLKFQDFKSHILNCAYCIFDNFIEDETLRFIRKLEKPAIALIDSDKSQFAKLIPFRTFKSPVDVVNYLRNELNVHAKPAEMFLFDLLRPTVWSSETRSFKKSYIQGTRTWAVEKAKAWLTPKENNQVMWFRAAAGSGKSVISHLIATFFENSDTVIVGATFFFRHNDAGKNSTKRLVANLIYDLSTRLQLPKFTAHVMKCLKEDVSVLNRPSVAFRQIICDGLGVCKEDLERRRLLILMDALDECVDRDILLRIISEGFSALPPSTRVFVTGRPDVDIFEALNALDSFSFVVPDAENEKDIRLYFGKELESYWFDSDGEREKEITIDKAARLSSGLFAYATSIFRFLKFSSIDGLSAVKAIENISAESQSTKGLYKMEKIYQLSLENAFASSRTEVFQNLIGFVVSAREPLHTDTLIDLAGISLPEAQETLHKSLSILSIDQNTVIPCHKTVSDFLTRKCIDPRFSINLERAEAAAAVRCLQILNSELYFNQLKMSLDQKNLDITESQRSNIFSKTLLYSVKYFVSHLVSVNQVSQNFEEEASEMLSKILEVLSDVLKFIREFSVPISESAYHIYASALMFCPSHSVLKELYVHLIPQEVKLLHGCLENWSFSRQVIEPGSSIRDVQFSRDGEFLVTAGDIADSRDDEGGVHVYRVVSGSGVSYMTEPKAYAVAFDKTSRFVFIGNSSGHLKKIRWATQEMDCQSSLADSHQQAVYGIAISPDGSLIATSSHDQTVRIWEAETLELKKILLKLNVISGSAVKCIEFARDSPVLVCGADDKNPYKASSAFLAYLWDFTDGIPEESSVEYFPGHTSHVHSVTLSGNGSLIAGGGMDGRILVWTRRESGFHELRWHKGDILGLGFSATAEHLVSADQFGFLCLWDWRSKQVLAKFSAHFEKIQRLRFSHHDQRIFATASRDKSVK
ncbi:POC1 centriolar protein A, partial [Entophlyctis sp. JEL0112]